MSEIFQDLLTVFTGVSAEIESKLESGEKLSDKVMIAIAHLLLFDKKAREELNLADDQVCLGIGYLEKILNKNNKENYEGFLRFQEGAKDSFAFDAVCLESKASFEALDKILEDLKEAEENKGRTAFLELDDDAA